MTEAIPSMMFDGLVEVFSTCRDCGHIMRATSAGDTVHPNCQPKPTKVESLVQGWLSAVLADDTDTGIFTEQAILELDARPPRLLDAALVYASWGWPVFPLMPQSKQPGTKHGFKDATTDPDHIRWWWSHQNYEDYNIGLPTGHTFDVIDIDPKNGGAQSFITLLTGPPAWRDNDKMPAVHGVVSTSSSGLHLYVKATGKGNFAGERNLRPGIDYRGLGGYVVAPPSTRGPARAWAWGTAPSPIIKGINIYE